MGWWKGEEEEEEEEWRENRKGKRGRGWGEGGEGRRKESSYPHVFQLRWKSPRSHSSGVGLENTIHILDVSRGNAQPNAHTASCAVA